MIQAKNLRKTYGDTVVLGDISFTVSSGQIVGVLGRKGCGKTTIADILTGCLSCEGGQVSIGGFDIERYPKKAKSQIGYLPEKNPIYPDMTVFEYLMFSARLKRLPRARRAQYIEKAMETTRSSGLSRQLIAHLSFGEARRVGLAAAILGDPHILLLDSPTEGLSPSDSRQIRQIIKELRAGRTIMLFSSSLSEVADICHSVLVLNSGKIAAHESLARLRHVAGDKSRLKLRLVATPEQVRLMASRLPGLLDLDLTAGLEGGTVDAILESYAADDLRAAVWEYCQQLRTPVLEMRYLNISLEDIFLQLTGKTGGGV
ncbi:MAG: ABC transporter ATP-binding protein [Christensenellaceae bacterium]|nr:ABC transporter ATP-binding protein [Christensenellaceae bacterium]